MIDETIISIHIPESEGWFVMRTEKGIYSLIPGGVKMESALEGLHYEWLETPALQKKIANVYTDGSCVVMETWEGNALHHCPSAGINRDGTTCFGIRYLEKGRFLKLKEAYTSNQSVSFRKITEFN